LGEQARLFRARVDRRRNDFASLKIPPAGESVLEGVGMADRPLREVWRRGATKWTGGVTCSGRAPGLSEEIQEWLEPLCSRNVAMRTRRSSGELSEAWRGKKKPVPGRIEKELLHDEGRIRWIPKKCNGITICRNV